MLLRTGLLALSVSLACHASFLIPGFSPSPEIVLNGAAVITAGVLSLSPGQSGSAWYATQQTVADGFATSFAFRITPDVPQHADGIWFMIQNDSLTPAIHASNSFGIEFDTFENIWDPNDNHVAFMSCGSSSNTTVNNACLLAVNSALPTTLADGQVHTAFIRYAAGTMTLSLDGMEVLQTAADLGSMLNLTNGKAWVGFQAPVGAYRESNDILNWQFTEVPEPGTAALLLVSAPLLVLRRYFFSLRNRSRSAAYW